MKKNFSQVLRLRGPLCISFLLTVLPACGDRGDQQRLDELIDGMTRKFTQASESLEKMVPVTRGMRDMTMEEVSKLSAWEYLVRDVDENLSAEEMNILLSAFGRDRWDCYASLDTGAKIRLFCKRRPETYLKYVTQILPGLVP